METLNSAIVYSIIKLEETMLDIIVNDMFSNYKEYWGHEKKDPIHKKIN